MKRTSHKVTKPSSTNSRRRTMNRLWRYRVARELSQRQIARLLGLTTSAPISRWEHGVKIPTLENALLLSLILKVPVEALFAERIAELETMLGHRAAKIAASSGRRDSTYEPAHA